MTNLLTSDIMPPRSALRGVLIGVLLCSPVIVALGWLAAPQIEGYIDPILLTRIGDGTVAPAPWNRVIRAPWRWGDRACWQMGLAKLRNSRPIALTFYRINKDDGQIFLSATQFDDFGHEIFYSDHLQGQNWINTYCSDPNINIHPNESLTIGGSFTYRPRHNLWRITQSFPLVHVPAVEPIIHP